jgi:hypothetical protein
MEREPVRINHKHRPPGFGVGFGVGPRILTFLTTFHLGIRDFGGYLAALITRAAVNMLKCGD